MTLLFLTSLVEMKALLDRSYTLETNRINRCTLERSTALEIERRNRKWQGEK
jgi:hypothetical protein